MGMNGGNTNTRVLVAGLVIAGSLSLMTMGANGLAEDEVGTRGMQPLVKPGVSGQPGASAQANAQLPAFPQKFEVQGPEADTFGFAVTQPGPVIVDVQAEGAPLVVTLQSPGGQPITQQATGNLRMNYTVTPQDVQRSFFWHIQVRLAQPMPPQLGGRANGMVNVQHPAANQAAVQQTIQALSARQKRATQEEQEQGASQAKAQMDQAFQQRKAQFEQQQQQRHASLHAQMQPQLDQLRSRLGGPIRPRGLESSEGTTGEPVSSPDGEVGTRALQFERIQKIMPLTPVPPPSPVITSLSVAQGQPGDPVMINGSGFGTAGGEVHFILGLNNDVVYTGQTWWYDNQILVNVPDVTGIVGYNGQVYVVRNPDKIKSPMTPFRFNPALDVREIRATTDRIIKWPYYDTSPAYEVQHAHANFLAGFKDNDVLFGNTRLKNGWVADEAFVTCQYGSGWANFCDGGAYVWEIKKGTDWPYLNVRWWMPPAPFANYAHTYYSFSVRIVGPKGVPDGVAVP